MKHPQLPEGQLIEVPDAAVDGHRRSGWEITDQPRPKPTAAEIEPVESGPEPDTDAAAVPRPDESTPAQDGKE